MCKQFLSFPIGIVLLHKGPLGSLSISNENFKQKVQANKFGSDPTWKG